MKNLVVLGCTGSIGTTALTAIAKRHPDVRIVAVSAHTNAKTLGETARRFGCKAMCLTGGICPAVEGIACYSFMDGLEAMLGSFEADIVLNGIAGFDGLRATIAGIEGGMDIALANKESVVCGGSYLFDLAHRHGSTIIPVDSEHSAIHELLKNRRAEDVASLLITASGGPFVDLPKEAFETITVEQALHHPTWKMGRKITIDSASMANKALEVIEASYLFAVPPEHIEVVIHRQSIVHSMVRMIDGAVYAQLGIPDMTLPIMNAIDDDYHGALVPPLGFSHLDLTFSAPDFDRFPLLALAFDILRRKGGAAIAFNAADEVAVAAFLAHRCTYSQMVGIIQKTLEAPWNETPTNLEETMAIDAAARTLAEGLL